MSAPVGLLAASALLWGWFAELLPVAAPIAVVLEAWRWTDARWDLSAKDFQRIADFGTWAFVLIAGYFIVTKGWPLPILQILEWLPLVLAPLIAAQLYSSAGRIELSALFLSLRSDSVGALARERVDLSFAYAGICILAAGAANVRTPWYFVAAAALTVWALWGVRSRRYALWVWIALVVVAVGAGYAGHHGLSRLQTWVFNVAVDYFQLDMARTDPYRSMTDIGHIGELKSSERILLRVAAPRDVALPLLLHRATYDGYGSATWFAREGQFAEQLIDEGNGRWTLDRTVPARIEVSISETLVNGVGVLSLPAATASVSGLGPAVLRRNRFGTIRVERTPGVIRYTAVGANGPHAALEPRASDLQLPVAEAVAVARIVERLGLSSLAAEDKVKALKAFFADGFRYSTFRRERIGTRRAITEFLSDSRSGHCEYFATATVLLARAAGIPARYATGFSVQEFSDVEQRFIVRERHAHAWARLYVNGAWHDVDTTPPQWFAEEAAGASAWQPINDFASWLMFRLAEWRARPPGEKSSFGWLALVFLLFGVLMWRLFRGMRLARKSSAGGQRRAFNEARPDDPFHGIEQRMAEKGLPRLATETARDWIARIAPQFDADSRSALQGLLRWHYRSRFDPLKMSPADRQAYAQAAMHWQKQDPSPRPPEQSVA